MKLYEKEQTSPTLMKLKSMTTDKRNNSTEPLTRPSIDSEPNIEHPVSVKINEACLNGDEDCPCVVKEVKREYNPI